LTVGATVCFPRVTELPGATQDLVDREQYSELVKTMDLSVVAFFCIHMCII
jgi:hypothetical protein